MVRTIQAPGVELKETNILNTATSQTAYNLVDTVVLVNGFADTGENYTTQWINSKQTFENTYGYPTNEPEMYFYNAAMEVLNKGGLLLASKLPYDNESLNTYKSITYNFNKLTVDTENLSVAEYTYISSLVSQLDSSLTNGTTPFLSVNLDIITTPNDNNFKIDTNVLDNYKTQTTLVDTNKLKIIDISKTKYTSFETQDNQNDCKHILGLVPVIVTPLNALLLQYKNLLTSYINQISNYINPVSQLSVLSASDEQPHVLSNINNYAIYLNSDDINITTVSKIATEIFPTIQFLDNDLLDKTYLKCIGIAVFKAYQDKSNNSKINFQLLETFIGSLDKTAKNPITHSSMFIDNVVNNNSKYINVFSNVKKDFINDTSLIVGSNLDSYSMGFSQAELVKKIDYTKSIINPLNIIFERASNINNVPIDLVIDAGVSTIAQAVFNNTINHSYNFSDNLNITLSKLTNSNTNTNAWFTIIQKYDEFCKFTRRDCMFLADILRSFCLDNNEKIVRPTNLTSNIDTEIIPNLRYFTKINSSYTAGYSNWFKINDIYSNDLFWCPPSIKAVGIYIYCDTYFKKWDAPAGIVRGRLNNVIDTAFTPNNTNAGQLYAQCWNYAMNYPLDGIVLEGQKTMQLQKTAFDRVNVRRLFLYLEKSVIRAAKYFVYEKNTEYLRQRFVDMIKPIFEDAVSGSGILEYYIICDERNNTPETIDRNELHCQIIVKPIKTIEYIVLNFVCAQQNSTIAETTLQ